MEKDLGSPSTSATPHHMQHTYSHACHVQPLQTYASHPEPRWPLRPHPSSLLWAPPICVRRLGLTLPGSWSRHREGRKHTHQPQPCLWGTVYFSMKAVSRSREPLCSRWIWLANCRLISRDSELRLGRWEFWKLCQRSFLRSGEWWRRPEEQVWVNLRKGPVLLVPLYSQKKENAGRWAHCPHYCWAQGGENSLSASRAFQWPRCCQGGRWHRLQAHLVPASRSSPYPSRTAVEGLL